MIRDFMMCSTALASVALSSAAAAQSTDDAPQAYVEHLPCGGMDCSYTPEQQERLRQGDELQAMMVEFSRDLTRATNTQGWGSSYDDLDGNISLLQDNLQNLEQLWSTAGRIDQLWDQVNGGQERIGSTERLQSLVDATRQSLEREREIRRVYKNTTRGNLQLSDSGNSFPAGSSQPAVIVPPAPAAAAQQTTSAPSASRGAGSASPSASWSKRVPAYFYCMANYTASRSDIFVSDIGVWHAYQYHNEEQIRDRLRDRYREEMERLMTQPGILNNAESGCRVVWRTSDTSNYAAQLAEVETDQQRRIQTMNEDPRITVQRARVFRGNQGRISQY